ncbi:MAG: SusD/RagB family nutrient-binding outer membrane lipoprotein, partial [Tannerellaceae bacterium]|nr:SusD/RagB family nutrient-binding outer membrane lipoprotein [Tannerellaceae bacterium]
RRTGYPKLFPAVTNYSEGNIPKGEFPKRLRFPRNDRNSNLAEVEKARTMLKGPDHEGTRLWWDVEGGNF